MLLQELDVGRGCSCGPAAAPGPPQSPLVCFCCAPGKAYSLGRAEYGRLGLGTGAQEKSTPTVIPELPSITSVACGASVGYAVSRDGECWALGSLPSSLPSSSLHAAVPTFTTHCQVPWGWITWGWAVAAQMCLWVCGDGVVRWCWPGGRCWPDNLFCGSTDARALCLCAVSAGRKIWSGLWV